MLKMKELINNSSKKIIISGWKREFSECKKELMSAKKRGVRCTIFSFTEVDEKLGKIVSYKLDGMSLEKFGRLK